MKKSAKKKSYTIYALQYPIFLLIATLMVATLNLTKIANSSAVPKVSDGDVLGKDGGKSGKVEKGNSNKPDKPGKPENAGKNENKGNRGVRKSNSIEHRVEMKQVVGKLKEVSDEEEQLGNEEASEEIDEVIEEEEEELDEVAEAIEDVEARPKWKTLLLGTDYKNLGKLRSHLAHNTNSIRKLQRVQNKVWAEGNEEDVQAQMGELLQERERIRNVIQEHEDDFGILGWVFRFLNGYIGGDLEDGIEEYVDVPESTESEDPEPIM